MGREATCRCTWAGETALCKVLLEPSELILRGSIKRRVSLSAISGIAVQTDQLKFCAGSEQVTLELGSAAAPRWAAALTADPPSLAKKLGICSASKVLLVGDEEEPELKAAVAEAGTIGGQEINLILARVDTRVELHRALEQCLPYVTKGAALWIIYPKGRPKSPSLQLSQSAVLETLRASGLIDTKVASVSAALTGLRFIKRTR